MMATGSSLHFHKLMIILIMDTFNLIIKYECQSSFEIIIQIFIGYRTRYMGS